MEEIKTILQEAGCSCVVKNFDQVFTFKQRGVLDLYQMIKDKPGFLKEALIADKVVGKGAAALMILGGISNLYAEIISLPALTLLRDAGVEVDYGNVVPFIWNRTKTDWCPIEKMCNNKTSAQDILPLIEDFLYRMKSNQRGQTATI